MLIRVIYSDGRYDMVKDSSLERFISEGRILKFRRGKGWVNVAVGPLRGEGGNPYHGIERRGVLRHATYS